MAATTAAVVGAGAAAYGASKSGKAAEKAGEAQAEASEAGVAEQRRQFDKVVELLSPFVQAGTGALSEQQAILGLKGVEEQQRALINVEGSPYFQNIYRQGEDALLQNVAATGGLRGGNIQAALAKFRPQLLNQLVEQRYANLGGLTQIGQASAARQAASGIQTGQTIANLRAQQGAAQAGAILGKAGAQQQGISDLISLGGALYGAGAF